MKVDESSLIVRAHHFSLECFDSILPKLNLRYFNPHYSFLCCYYPLLIYWNLNLIGKLLKSIYYFQLRFWRFRL